jgi:hypothetical protein
MQAISSMYEVLRWTGWELTEVARLGDSTGHRGDLRRRSALSPLPRAIRTEYRSRC